MKRWCDVEDAFIRWCDYVFMIMCLWLCVYDYVTNNAMLMCWCDEMLVSRYWGAHVVILYNWCGKGLRFFWNSNTSKAKQCGKEVEGINPFLKIFGGNMNDGRVLDKNKHNLFCTAHQNHHSIISTFGYM